ncbi:MAG: cobalt-precorrin 5A hydrolase [Cellulosilyticaceae bacterium]
MRIAMISFTLNGAKINAEIVDGLKTYGRKNNQDITEIDNQDTIEANTFRLEGEHGVEGYHLSRTAVPNLIQVNTSLKEWTEKAFATSQAIIFIGATGIAVRAIAPFIRSKDVDPAVIVLDDQGEYVISLLSGHIGGANELTREVAKLVEGRPVISTATDGHKVFAVDEWAKKSDLVIKEISHIKYVSSAFLNGEKVGLSTPFSIASRLPANMTIEKAEIGVVIDLSGKSNPFTYTLHLIPQILTLGIGCKRGTSRDAIEELVGMYLEEMSIDRQAIRNVATIDLKKDEEGLLSFCEKYNKPLKIYTSEELKAVAGDFTPSAFVKSITGVENVCERAAVLGSGCGELLLRKSSLNGVTLAIAQTAYKINFDR